MDLILDTVMNTFQVFCLENWDPSTLWCVLIRTHQLASERIRSIVLPFGGGGGGLNRLNSESKLSAFFTA